MKRREIIPVEQYSAVLEELSKKKPAEDESEAVYFEGEATDYSDQETDSETDVVDNPAHEEYSGSNSKRKCLYHPSIQSLIVIYHKNPVVYN
ncbi:hypothetical protein AVEN_60384-1 [Araneus ventricosus]|uniref:Uncharacterized protein n=1 Tax=Araneus ventricosus TaxID=182803 RepID=A0A4Y2H5P0_ARAVE|nr:hypothetical protein AVEN_60384-1 [Araneus ventricosus]